MANILIAVPLHTGIHRTTLECLMTLQHSRSYQSDIVLLRGGDDHIADPKVRIAWKYNQARDLLLRGGYDYLLTIEQDIVFAPDSLTRLLAAMDDYNADVGYGLYCFRQPPFYRWNLFPCMDPQTFTGQSLSFYPERARAAWNAIVDVAGQGNGFTLIRRHVLERIRYRVENHAAAAHSSQDTYFAFDCQTAGYRQIGHLGVVCGHIHQIGGQWVVLWPDVTTESFYRVETLT